MYIGGCQLEKLNRWTLDGDQIVFKEVEFVPALLKMFDEIVSNSIDEAIRTNFKHANKINIQIKPDHVIVADNGRGIPVVASIDDPNSTSAVMALTHLRAGANFEDDGAVSIGTHGLGASLVNILSRKFIAWSDDGKKRQHIRCADQMRETKTSITTSFASGVSIEYWPDFSFFDCKNMSGDLSVLLQKRVHDLAANFPQIQFMLNGSKIKAASFKNYVSMLALPFEIHETDKFKVAVVASEEYNQISFVNGIDTYEGGAHVDYVRAVLIPEILGRLKKKYKKLDLGTLDVKSKLTFVVMSASIPKPKFRSQTKEYITNSPAEMGKVFAGVADEKFVRHICGNEEIINKIVETKQFKLELQEHRDANDKQKNMKKVRVPKHIPANGDPAKATLFLVEGDSAAGPFTKARDAEKHGAFPLRGKPLNTYGEKPNTILGNAELLQLMSILNLKFGDGPGTKLNYGKIAIMADADVDGYNICCLMLAFFNHWPWLFKEGRVFIVRCPIMKCTKGKEIQRFYNLDSYVKAKIDSTWKINYLKGLGSLTPEEYELMVNHPVLEKVSYDIDAPKYLDIAFGPDSEKRKVWLDKM
jgi:DNA topoisomerase-2